MNQPIVGRPIEILLVEDNPGDVLLTRELLEEAKMLNGLHVVGDGEEAMAFLRCEGAHANAVRPDLILLDLQLPKKHGREVLAEIREDEALADIPVAVLTLSTDEKDVLASYDLDADCYISKPLELDEFVTIVKTIDHFNLAILTGAPRRQPGQ